MDKWQYSKKLSGSTVTDSDGNKYDFDNFIIAEKSVPYMFGLKSKTEITKSNDTEQEEFITVTNFFRPVIYISKSMLGVPEGQENIPKTFTYKLKIKENAYDNAGQLTGSTVLKETDIFNETTNPNGAYKLLNRTILVPATGADTYTHYTEEQQTAIDPRVDGDLYWYPVDESVGLYETPQGWEAYPTKEKLDALGENHSSVSKESEGDDGYFTIQFDAGETSVVAIPIYIQHKIDGNDVGMLLKREITDENGTHIVYLPRYDFEIEEVISDSEEWKCITPDNKIAVTDLNNEVNALSFTNAYKYKDVLLKKTVTHAHDNLSNFAFTFQLFEKTTDAQEKEILTPHYKYGKNDTPVKWKLYTQASDGNLIPYPDKDNQLTGTVDDQGRFIVPNCGNDSESTENPFVIAIQGLEMEKTYTIKEILDSSNVLTLPDAYANKYVVATTDDFKATKDSDTKLISKNALTTTMNIENDYIKRDITIKKTVVAASSPTKDFEMVLAPENGQLDFTSLKYEIKDDKNNTIDLTKSEYESYSVSKVKFPRDNEVENAYSFKLKNNWSIVFKSIGQYGEKFNLYEKFDVDYRPITLDYTIPDGATEPVSGYSNKSDKSEITLAQNADSSFPVVNGEPGYIVIRKEFTGDTDFNSAGHPIRFSIIGGSPANPFTIADKYITIIDSSDSTAEPRYYGTLSDIEISESEFAVINMKSIFGENYTYTVRETKYDSEVISSDGSLYLIQPEQEEISCTVEDVQTIIKNRVTKFETPIYKRIGGEAGQTIPNPSGKITFQLTQNDEPVSGVQCVPAYVSQGKTKYLTANKAVSDENGCITINYDDLTDIQSWSQNDGTTKYFLKLMFDRDVKINPTDNSSIAINEVSSIDTWGVLVGYESYDSDPDNKIQKSVLNDKQQWTAQNADTFVNTKETEQIEVTKWVDGFKADDDETFSFTIAEWFGTEKDYLPVENIKYTVYELTDRTNEYNASSNPYKTPFKSTGSIDSQGTFYLKHGQKAVIELPKNAYWQITENNTGKYKLLVDSDGKITHGGSTDTDKATHYTPDTGNPQNISDTKIEQGFDLNSEMDMDLIKEGCSVVLVNYDETPSATNYMFVVYDPLNDMYTLATDADKNNESKIIRQMRSPDGELKEYAGNKSDYYSTTDLKSKYFYNNDEKNSSKYKEGTKIDKNVTNEIQTLTDNGFETIWSVASNGNASPITDYWKVDNLTIPDYIYYTEDGELKRHKVIGIGKSAFYSKKIF